MAAHIPLSSTGSTIYERVMGHAPHVLASWSALENTFFARSILSPELLEQVRRTLASGHGCEYCLAKAGPPSRTHNELRTSLATWYAEAFAKDHKAIEPSQISVLREHFTDAELVELIAFVSFMWAGGTFGKVLGIQPQEERSSSDAGAVQSSASAA
jgi:alkylhydroperoxidase family enzyme